LIDELAGRTIAMERGLAVVGTLGVLLRAKQVGLCILVGPLLDRLQAEINFFIAPALRKKILQQAGEHSPAQ
jgi:predicted nucleic acid-binding protein